MKSRIRKLSSFFTIVGLFILLILLILKIAKGTIFRVSKVSIVAHQDIFDHLTVFKQKQNLLFLSTNNLSEQIIETYPYVKSVRIQKKYPITLVIHIEERQPVVEYLENEKHFYIDDSGRILPILNRNFGQLPRLNCKLNIEDDSVNDSRLINAIKVVADLTKNSQEHVEELKCQEYDAIVITLDKTEVIFSAFDDPTEVVASLQFLLNQFRIEGKFPEEIDLRFEKPILTPAGLKQASISSESTKNN